jgi:hypothetical protein
LVLVFGSAAATTVLAGFTPPQMIESGAFEGSFTDVCSGDIDGDGDIDLAAAISERGPVVWYKNEDGKGVYSSEILVSDAFDKHINLKIVDIDGDQDVDLLVTDQDANRVEWFKNIDGAGNFGDPQIITRAIYQPVESWPGDIDGDGDPDLLVYSASSQTLYAIQNHSEGERFRSIESIKSFRNFVGDLKYADLDGDSDLDLAVLSSGSLVWLENVAGTNGFKEHLVSDFSLRRSIAVADLDSDGNLDLVTQAGWFSNLAGTGTFKLEERFVIPGEIAAADLDNDGDTDVVEFNNISTGPAYWFANTDGQGTFGSRVKIVEDGGTRLKFLRPFGLNR